MLSTTVADWTIIGRGARAARPHRDTTPGAGPERRDEPAGYQSLASDAVSGHPAIGRRRATSICETASDMNMRFSYAHRGDRFLRAPDGKSTGNRALEQHGHRHSSRSGADAVPTGGGLARTRSLSWGREPVGRSEAGDIRRFRLGVGRCQCNNPPRRPVCVCVRCLMGGTNVVPPGATAFRTRPRHR